MAEYIEYAERRPKVNSQHAVTDTSWLTNRGLLADLFTANISALTSSPSFLSVCFNLFTSPISSLEYITVILFPNSRKLSSLDKFELQTFYEQYLKLYFYDRKASMSYGLFRKVVSQFYMIAKSNHLWILLKRFEFNLQNSSWWVE